MSEKIESIAGVGFVILVLAGILCTGCGKLADKIEIGAKRVWPSYETRAEKSLKEKVERERVFAILERWLDEWAPNELTGFIKLNALNYKNRFALGKIGENIWVVKDLPYDKPGEYYSNVYIFHSSDDGSSWEIQWKRPATRDWSGIDLTAIVVINEKKAAVMLSSGGRLGMLYTIDRGKSWQIEDKWDLGRIRNLPDP